MIIKRFIGKDTGEAMQKVKINMGSDAIILNERKIRKRGLIGLFKKPYVEILAARDEDMKTDKKQIEPVASKRDNEKKIFKHINNDEYENDIGKNNTVLKLESKVKNMEYMLNQIYGRMNSKEEKEDTSIGNSQEEFLSKQPQIIQVFAKNLLRNSVDENLVREIVKNVNLYISDNHDINEIQSCFYENIIEKLGNPQPIISEKGICKKVIFLGPTGVGKTTTLAKIAANFSFNNVNVGIISTDTFRIAAVEQLKTYADILKLPVSVVYSPEEIPQAIEDYYDKELILIDTAGSSHKDIEQFDELKKIVEITQPDEVFLLISLTTDKNVYYDILRSYDFLNEYKVIFTKQDEALHSGSILNIKEITKKGLSYITTGQSVPDDIILADVNDITNSLLGSL
jgi:flagellar biosynthesis protein FlhF